MPITPEQKARVAALAKRINESSDADFVKRLLEGKSRKYIRNMDGTVSTHELGYADDGRGNAVVFPTVQDTGFGLARYPYPWSYDRAVSRGDTVQMSVPDAELFTENYKEVYPGFNQYAGGGKSFLSRALPSPVSLTVQVPYAPGYVDENLRLNRQRYAESGFNDRAKSPVGATGAYQIMPITQKDYLSRGKGKAGNLLDPNYNRKIRDFALDIVPRDLGDTWSDDDSEQVRLAKQYAGYNWGAGSLKKYLRKQRNAGVDISNSLDWMSGLPKETRDYVDFIVLGNDVPGTSKTMDAYRKAWGKYSSEPFPEDSVATVQPDWSFDDGGTLLHDYKSGGKIRIKPSKKGTFTAAAKKHGKSVQAFASQVLAHKSNYSPAMVKKANFARNAAKWHAEGGYLDRIVATYGSVEAARDAIAKLRAKSPK